MQDAIFGEGKLASFSGCKTLRKGLGLTFTPSQRSAQYFYSAQTGEVTASLGTSLAKIREQRVQGKQNSSTKSLRQD
jgi:hypothetical protein